MKMVLGDIYDDRSIANFAEIILETYAGFTKNEIYAQPEKTVSESVLLKINSAIKLLKTEMPIEYITGFVHFYGLKLKVNQNVLIPRPETEELVDLILKNEHQNNQDLKIMDAATGSGSIAIALKANLPVAEVFAFDIRNEALDIAKVNAAENNVNVQFFVDDLLNYSYKQTLPELDILVSNPPYVKDSEKALMHKNVLDFEPHIALFVEDENPLIFYSALAALGHKILKNKGLLYCEINEALGGETAKVFESYNYTDVRVIKDLNGKDRFVRCIKNY